MRGPWAESEDGGACHGDHGLLPSHSLARAMHPSNHAPSSGTTASTIDDLGLEWKKHNPSNSRSCVPLSPAVSRRDRSEKLHGAGKLEEHRLYCCSLKHEGEGRIGAERWLEEIGGEGRRRRS